MEPDTEQTGQTTETGYEPPSLVKVGDFASDTHGSVSVGSSDDSDAGQYYTP